MLCSGFRLLVEEYRVSREELTASVGDRARQRRLVDKLAPTSSYNGTENGTEVETWQAARDQPAGA